MTEENSNPYDNTSAFILVAEELKRIVSTESEVIYSDAEKLSILLRQNLGSKYIREVFLLIAPTRANIVRHLLYVSDRRDLNRKLSSAIENIRAQTGYNEAESRWAVYSWAYALDKVTQKEFYQVNKLFGVPSNTNILHTPMEDVSQTPMEDVSQTPMEDVSQTPMEDVSQTPMEDVSQTPMEDVSQTPMEDVSQTPMEDVSQTPMEDVSPTSREDDEPPIVEDVFPKHVHGRDYMHGLRYILSNNRIRIPLGIAIVAGIIALIVVTTNQTNELPTPAFSILPESAVAGNNVTVDATASSDKDGSITKYIWNLNLRMNNGSVIEMPHSQNTPKIEFHTPLDKSAYLVQVKLTVEDNQNATSVSEKSIEVEPEKITIRID